jgi:hypothetical protein
MPVDVDAGEQFVYANARLLDRHRLAVLLHGAPVAPVLQVLHAYRNADGGFGHALEPDVRAPQSEPAAMLHALEVLAEIDALDNPMVKAAAAWAGTIAHADSGLPFVLPTAAGYPHAPWMAPSDEGSFLTFAIAARLWEAGSSEPWLARATEWCWARLEGPGDLGGYWMKFALDFLDHVPGQARASTAVEQLRSRLRADGSMPVPGGTENERLTPLALSPHPGKRSRTLFTDAQIETDLDLLEHAQQDDGGWAFDWLGWSPGQSVEWRGIMTLRALGTLSAHKRIRPPQRG